jgi:hypothetical protein
MLFSRALTPARMLGMGVVFLVFGAFIGYQSWGLDHGLPAASTLRTARGAVESVQHRKGLELRLMGHAEAFRLPRSTHPSQHMAAALDQAARERSHQVELRYSPKPARTITGEEHRLFYELSIDGRAVHSYEETRSAWRETRRVGRTLAQISAGLGIAFALLAFRKARASKSWTAQDAPR